MDLSHICKIEYVKPVVKQIEDEDENEDEDEDEDDDENEDDDIPAVFSTASS